MMATLPTRTVCPTCGGCRVASLTWMGEDRWRPEPCPDCCCEVCGQTTDTPPLCARCETADDAAFERRADQ